MTDTDIELYVDRVITYLRDKKESAKDYIVNGNCSNMEDYKYIIGQFAALSDLEMVMQSMYNKYQDETYGRLGDTDYVETSVKEKT